MNYPIVDSNNNLFKRKSLEGMNFAISVGDIKIRTSLANQIRDKGGVLPSIIHPTAIVSKYTDIARGVVIQANSVVQAGVTILKDTVISYNASVTHHSYIGESLEISNSIVGNNILHNFYIGEKIKLTEKSIIGNLNLTSPKEWFCNLFSKKIRTKFSTSLYYIQQSFYH